ncbi:MAG TPA: glycosyltransferase [Candidatus Diapherotrites archaeon]|nr:glycosyltransferase [Candidatus Diapherotrites archaeon]
MKILFITEKYPPIVCAGNRVYNLVKELSNIYDITVMCRENNRWLFPMPVDNTIPKLHKVNEIGFKIYDSLFLIPTMILFKLKLISNSKFYFKSMKKIIDKNVDIFSNFDLVIVSGPSWEAFKGAEYLFDKFNIPFILDYRDPWVSRNKKELEVQKRIINKAKAVVTVTNSCVGKIKQIANYKKDILIIKNGVDLNSVQGLKKQIKDNKLRIGFAGNFVNYHNVDVLLRAMSKLPIEIKENIIFEGCGGPYQKKCERLSKKLGVVSNYYGHLSLDKMNKVLNNCHLFYLGTIINDAVSGKFYNYLSLNKPILCYTFKNSQLDKEIKNNKLGFVCYSESELTEKIKEIYNNRNMLSENNFKIKEYIKNFDWKVLAKKYNHVIQNS